MSASLSEFRTVYLSSPVPTLISRHHDGVILDVNHSFLHLTGYSQYEVIGHTATELQLWADGLHDRISGELQEKGAVINIASTIRTKERDERVTLTSLQIVELDGVRCVMRTDYDITERKLSDEALRASEEKFHSLVNSMEDLVLVLDDLLTIVGVHGSWPLTNGLNPKAMLGLKVHEIVGSAGASVHEDACQRALTGENRIYELTFMLACGIRDMQVSLSPLRSSEGTVIGLVLVGRDVTSMKRAELELRQRDERLQEVERVESLGRLAGSVAHDFNNLLTIINGYCELLLGDGSMTPKAELRLREIAKAGERAAALTGQLLAFGRREVAQKSVIDLNVTILEMTAMLQHLLGGQVTLTTGLDPAIGSIHADPGQIGQVIMNLAVNARDAMPAGGRLIVETVNVDVTEDYAKWHPALHPGPYVQLSISDTGTGMDRVTQARIFEPFFTTKEKNHGTGLGLSIVHGIIKQSGGEILVYSEKGRGTIFKVYLPRVANSVESVPAAIPLLHDLRGSETVLVADDEAVIRGLTRQVLEENGYHVLEAADGQQALDLIKHHPSSIHLLVTDIVMPHRSGTELVRELRELGHTMKVLYMSGYTGKYYDELELSDPDSLFLQKPFQPLALLQRARQLLGTPALIA